MLGAIFKEDFGIEPSENVLIGPVPQITRFQCLNTYGWSQYLCFCEVIKVPYYEMGLLSVKY